MKKQQAIQNRNQEIIQREYIIDLEKLDKKIERYISPDTFCTFSKTDIKETIEEIQDIVRECITEKQDYDAATKAQERGRLLNKLERDITIYSQSTNGFSFTKNGVLNILKTYRLPHQSEPPK